MASGQLRVRYASGRADIVRFDAMNPPGALLLGTADADGDGRSEVFVRSTAGAATQFATVFRYVAGHLQVVTLNGEQTRLAYGGTVTHEDAWVVGWRGTPIVTWSGASTDDKTYPGTLRYYTFRGTTMDLLRTRTYTVTSDNPPPHGGLLSEPVSPSW